MLSFTFGHNRSLTSYLQCWRLLCSVQILCVKISVRCALTTNFVCRDGDVYLENKLLLFIRFYLVVLLFYLLSYIYYNYVSLFCLTLIC